jgi:hypothetical protein
MEKALWEKEMERPMQERFHTSLWIDQASLLLWFHQLALGVMPTSLAFTSRLIVASAFFEVRTVKAHLLAEYVLVMIQIP